MSSEMVIQARGLCKAYQIYQRPEDRLKQMLCLGRKKYYHEFWALRDVDLDVYRGETLGIIGANGAGKSTFLQIVCGVLQPTSGQIDIKGRVAALLELGAGFNPEFTGMENIHICASIMGMPDAQIRDKLDEIVSFADIGEFIEQPVKFYSSGMFTRLAFAIAMSANPEILVVDEILAVGDELFQSKCIRRFQEMKENGATILFVSHSANSILQLCDRALYLHKGQMGGLGDPRRVVASYQNALYGYRAPDSAGDADSNGSGNNGGEGSNNGLGPDPYANLREIPFMGGPDAVCHIRRVGVKGREWPNLSFEIGEEVTFVSECEILKDIDNAFTGMAVHLPHGLHCYHTNMMCREIGFQSFKAGTVIRSMFKMKLNLCTGTYLTTFDMQYYKNGKIQEASIIRDALKFSVEPRRLIDDGGVAFLNADLRWEEYQA
jgi:lipopolysaccharide transport system ATP-binding protein